MTKHPLAQGATPTEKGVEYRVWAPDRRVAVQVFPQDESSQRLIPLAASADGYRFAVDPAGRVGDRYLIKLDGAALPCPASQYQSKDVHGPAQVVSAAAFLWTDAAWQRPAFRDLVIYELHIGTFTPEGTFRAAIARLPHLESLGVNAIEIMPIADFPGARNWGYDGVLLYAPANVYGSPDDLRALIDAAHARKIAVILDVVYNHFGPDGNYLRQYSANYFESRHHTPWGEAVNFSNRAVRDFYVSNLAYWMDDFHFDGFRLDATHEIFDDSPVHILAELATFVHQRGGYIVAEDDRNDARLLEERASGGLALNGVWADDFHHTLNVSLVESSMYRDGFSGELSELVDVLQHGWSYRGQKAWRKETPRGTACDHLVPEHFVICISNHDQVGNRAFGERLNQLVSPEAYRAVSVLLCLTPYTPMLFMGQEWASSSPFQFFTDHHGELGRAVEAGRRREFESFRVFEKIEREIPSPQAVETFERSKLNWDEVTAEPYAACLRLYQAALRLRRAHSAFRPTDRHGLRVGALKVGLLALRLAAEDGDWLILFDPHGGHRGALTDDEIGHLGGSLQWRVQLSSNDPTFGGSGAPAFNEATAEFHFQQPEALVLKAEQR